MNERLAWMWINRLPGIGPVRFRQLLEVCGDASSLFQWTISDWEKTGATLEQAETYWRLCRDDSFRAVVENDFNQFQKGVFDVLIATDSDYPDSLRELHDHPAVLYGQGQWSGISLERIALVGSRRPTPYGLQVAAELSAGLVAAGCSTVSGLALGVDTVVHRSTLSSGGSTIAVLGNGIGRFYPRENERLQKEVAERGVVLSEMPPLTPPLAEHFPRRNRIISGLSKGVVVVEAAEKSGALITARYAGEQGRDVFAVPGNVYNAKARGCHILLRNGAALVESVSDILKEYGQETIRFQTEKSDDLSDLEKKVLDACAAEAQYIDVMAQGLKEPVQQISQIVLSLELKGYLERRPGQRYGKSHR